MLDDSTIALLQNVMANAEILGDEKPADVTNKDLIEILEWVLQIDEENKKLHHAIEELVEVCPSGRYVTTHPEGHDVNKLITEALR